MKTTLVHALDLFPRCKELEARFGPCALEAHLDVREDGIYVDIHDHALGDDYTLVGLAALRLEVGKLVLVSSSNDQLDVGGRDETRSTLYDPAVPYPSVVEDTEENTVRHRKEEELTTLTDSTMDANDHVSPTWQQEEVP